MEKYTNRAQDTKKVELLSDKMQMHIDNANNIAIELAYFSSNKNIPDDVREQLKAIANNLTDTKKYANQIITYFNEYVRTGHYTPKYLTDKDLNTLKEQIIRRLYTGVSISDAIMEAKILKEISIFDIIKVLEDKDFNPDGTLLSRTTAEKLTANNIKNIYALTLVNEDILNSMFATEKNEITYLVQRIKSNGPIRNMSFKSNQPIINENLSDKIITFLTENRLDTYGEVEDYGTEHDSEITDDEIRSFIKTITNENRASWPPANPFW